MEQPKTTTSKMRRVLVVEDESAVQRALTRTLRRACDVEVVGNCAHAIRALSGRDSELIIGVIADLLLPDGNGFEVIEHARDVRPGVPTLLITGHLDPDVAARAFAMGVKFLPKPFARENLLAFARGCLAQPSNALVEIESWATVWQGRYNLTDTEREVLVATVRGLSREELLASRSIAETTLKCHVSRILFKTGDESLDRAALRFMREVLHHGS